MILGLSIERFIATLATRLSSTAQSDEGNDDNGGTDGFHGVLLSAFSVVQLG